MHIGGKAVVALPPILYTHQNTLFNTTEVDVTSALLKERRKH